MDPTVQVVIDGRNIATPEDFYRALRAAEGVPDWTGDNVDALWDTVTGLIERPIDLTWTHAHLSKEKLGIQFMMMVAVMQEADGYTARRPGRPRFRFALTGANN